MKKTKQAPARTPAAAIHKPATATRRAEARVLPPATADFMEDRNQRDARPTPV